MWNRAIGRREKPIDEQARICHRALSEAWSGQKRDEVRGIGSGIDGARAFRVLIGVLKLSRENPTNPLTVITALEYLGVVVGIANYYSVRDALYELESLGWLTFEIGKQDDYGSDCRRSSKFALFAHRNSR